MNRKIISLFLATIISSVTAFFIFSPTPVKNSVSPEERQLIIAEQQIFADWYENYKYNIEQLDFCWQQYHRILKDFRQEIIDSDTAWERLKQLKNKQAYIVAEIKGLVPPKKLRSPLYDHTASIYKKTIDYADAQANTITLSLNVLNDETLREDSLIQKVEEICIAKAPTALFTAEDLTSVRNYLHIDEN